MNLYYTCQLDVETIMLNFQYNLSWPPMGFPFATLYSLMSHQQLLLSINLKWLQIAFYDICFWVYTATLMNALVSILCLRSSLKHVHFVNEIQCFCSISIMTMNFTTWPPFALGFICLSNQIYDFTVSQSYFHDSYWYRKDIEQQNLLSFPVD